MLSIRGNSQNHTTLVVGVCQGDKVVGLMEHVSHDGDRYVAAMTLDENMPEEVKNLAMGIRAVGEINEDGECHELNIEAIDFVDDMEKKCIITKS